MKIKLIRNATVKIEYGGKIWLVDPFFAEANSLPPFAGKSANPTVSLPILISEILRDVDYILITHLHPDHFDLKAQETISKSTPLIIQPSDFENIKKNGFNTVNAIESQKTFKSVKITRVEARHGEGDILRVMGNVSGYVLETPGEKSLYITGDTIWCDLIKRNLDMYEPDIVICNAGGNIFLPESNPFKDYVSLKRIHKVIMDEEQVLELLTYKKDISVITVHIGALDHETVSRHSIKEYLKNNHVNMKRVYVPEDGETIKF